jgi:hypothetical protein
VLDAEIDGSALTVTSVVAKQPAPAEYVIEAIPAEDPETIPEEVPIVAAVPVALHVPPEGVAERVAVPPTHIDAPDAMEGADMTVTVVTAMQVGAIAIA